MALPELIEIIPLSQPVRAEISVPGSKSITNRALILAALADGEVMLNGALWSEDTQVMVECLQELGFMVNVDADPAELQPYHHRLWRWWQGSPWWHDGTALESFCLQRRHGRQISGTISVPGQRSISLARGAPDAPATTSGAILSPA